MYIPWYLSSGSYGSVIINTSAPPPPPPPPYEMRKKKKNDLANTMYTLMYKKMKDQSVNMMKHETGHCEVMHKCLPTSVPVLPILLRAIL